MHNYIVDVTEVAFNYKGTEDGGVNLSPIE